jgi:hypothetical protein
MPDTSAVEQTNYVLHPPPAVCAMMEGGRKRGPIRKEAVADKSANESGGKDSVWVCCQISKCDSTRQSPLGKWRRKAPYSLVLL